MFLRNTLVLLCAVVLTGCDGSGTDPDPNPGGGNPAAQLPSVTAFRDCAAVRITDLVGLLDRLEAILTGAVSATSGHMSTTARGPWVR